MGLFTKWRARRKERKAQRQANRVERMQVRNERITLRGNKKNSLGSSLGQIATSIIPALSGGPQDNSPVTGTQRTDVVAVEGDMQTKIMGYLPLIAIAVVGYLVMKKSR